MVRTATVLKLGQNESAQNHVQYSGRQERDETPFVNGVIFARRNHRQAQQARVFDDLEDEGNVRQVTVLSGQIVAVKTAVHPSVHIAGRAVDSDSCPPNVLLGRKISYRRADRREQVRYLAVGLR